MFSEPLGYLNTYSLLSMIGLLFILTLSFPYCPCFFPINLPICCESSHIVNISYSGIKVPSFTTSCLKLSVGMSLWSYSLYSVTLCQLISSCGDFSFPGSPPSIRILDVSSLYDPKASSISF